VSEPENSVDTLAPETERAGSPLKSFLIGLLKFAIAGAILYILMRRGELHWDQLGAALSRWDITLSVVVLTTASYYGQAVRWRWLLQSRDIPIHSWSAFRYLMIGKFFNLVIPGYFSEDFVRGLYVIRRGGVSRTRVIVSLLVDRVAGVFSMLILVAFGLLTRPAVLADSRLRALLVIALGGMAAAGVGWVFMRLVPEAPGFLLRLAHLLRLHVHLDKVYAEASHYAHNLKLLVGVVALTLFNQTLMLMCFWLFGQTLQMDVSPLDYAVYVPSGLLTTMLPVAPVGLGVGQVAFLALFRLAGSDQGANLFSVYTAVVIFLNLAGGLLYLAHRDRPKA
jgi:hypothetical protein